MNSGPLAAKAFIEIHNQPPVEVRFSASPHGGCVVSGHDFCWIWKTIIEL